MVIVATDAPGFQVVELTSATSKISMSIPLAVLEAASEKTILPTSKVDVGWKLILSWRGAARPREAGEFASGSVENTGAPVS
jgi:hypothetical protein